MKTTTASKTGGGKLPPNSPGFGATAADPLGSLPLLGTTTVEDAVFYGAVGVVAIAGWVSWPAAGLIGMGHALHQRARNVIRSGAFGEARDGLIEAVEDVF